MSLCKYVPATTLIVILTFSVLASFSQATSISNDNKKIVIGMNRLFNEGKADSAMSFFSDSLKKAGNLNGKSAFQAMQDDIQVTFPDVQTRILEIWEEGDCVIVRCLFSGTHKGTARLPHHGGLLIGVPATNKSFSVQHIRIYKLANGKIVARQAIRDDLAMYQQLGLLPSPPPFKPPGNANADPKTGSR